MYTVLQKMRNKILREIDAIPFIQYQEELAYQAAVKKHIIHLPVLSKNDLNLVETINHEGVVITSLAELGMPSTLEILKAAKDLMPKIPQKITGHKNEFIVHASSQQIMQYPEIFLWGLEQRLLNIIENYLGLPVAYNGVYFRRDIANQVEQTSRLWHVDKENKKILKIIIYLNDINEDTGPFQYITQTLTSEIAQSLKYTSGYIQSQTMQGVVSPEHYKSCTGPAGTVIFAATGNIFHRGKIPVTADRFAIFFDYSSRRKRKSFYGTNSLSYKDLVLLTKNLPEQKKQCVFC
ncbi:2OG-Fe(II) oxygenase [Nostocales cyanobacterium LEGE 11386]|nr:2OG-Fe(II) oxygenase [Nostocales cyanobacterium LEGE 11386]